MNKRKRKEYIDEILKYHDKLKHIIEVQRKFGNNLGIIEEINTSSDIYCYLDNDFYGWQENEFKTYIEHLEELVGDDK